MCIRDRAALGPALAARRDPAARMAEAALTEMAASAGLVAAAGPAGVKERVRAALEQIAAEAAGRQRAGTGILATVASTAPFIGLFGTVWGIMSSFLAISAQKTTNLAVVAPGIAEALLVTGFGLVAAIPAVIVYNVILRRVARWRLDLEMCIRDRRGCVKCWKEYLTITVGKSRGYFLTVQVGIFRILSTSQHARILPRPALPLIYIPNG